MWDLRCISLAIGEVTALQFRSKTLRSKAATTLPPDSLAFYKFLWEGGGGGGHVSVPIKGAKVGIFSVSCCNLGFSSQCKASRGRLTVWGFALQQNAGGLSAALILCVAPPR